MSIPRNGLTETYALKVRARYGAWPAWYLAMVNDKVPQHMTAQIKKYEESDWARGEK